MSDPRAGDVWRYDYLWRRQHEAGETEGRKTRPVALVAAIAGQDGRTNLFILPITSKPPTGGRMAIEIPRIERRRAGLDDIPLWVMIDEYNHDILDASFYFDPNGRIGRFSAAAQERIAARVPRT